MISEDRVTAFVCGLGLGILLMAGAHLLDRHMRVSREARELAESALKWEQQVNKSYELGFKAGTLETLQIIEALCVLPKKTEN